MIRYDAKYNKQIQRVVDNFNRKIARLNKAGINLLPSKVSIKSIKKQFDNRVDLNVYLRELRKFSKRGAENIVTIDGKDFTAWDIEVFKSRLRRERTALTKDIAQAQAQRSQYPMQHDIYTQNLKAKRKALSSKWADIIVGKVGQKLIEQPTRSTQIYDNYLEILFQDAYQIGFEDEKIEYIKDRLIKLKPREFLRALEDDPNIQYIFDYYHSLTRTSGFDNNARDAFQNLYENIDAIVDKYKR